MKIAILYICTGNYKFFWKDFYESVNKHFFNQNEKHYFVFTDAKDLNYDNDVTIIEKQCKGFPNDSLFRFDMFLEVETLVLPYDYVFFFNANMLLLQDVSFEIFPSNNYRGIIGVIHPLGFKYRNYPSMFTYERNTMSKAYIKKEKKIYKYFMGGLNGGSVKEYYEMVKACHYNIHYDYRNNIVAVFHDESHLNKYCSEHATHSLSTAYGYPEGANLPFSPIIIIRDKVKVNECFDKHKEENLFGRFIRYGVQIYNALTW